MPPKGRGKSQLDRRLAMIEEISREKLKELAEEECAASEEHLTVAKATKDGYDRVKKEYETLLMAVEQVDTPDQFWKVCLRTWSLRCSVLMQTYTGRNFDKEYQDVLHVPCRHRHARQGR